MNDRGLYPPESRSPEEAARRRREALLLDPPRPSHEGSCGPWADCDGACMYLAYWSDAMARIRKTIRRHP